MIWNGKTIKQVYFLGLGGIGMSALARWFLFQGLSVSGYDKTQTPLTEALVKEGALISYKEAVSEIPEVVLSGKEISLIILTPAIPKDHEGRVWFESQGFTIAKRAAVLGAIGNPNRLLGVAGTHGKTTTSALLTHLLSFGTEPFGAFLGGIAKNFDSNLVLPKQANSALKPLIVAEADEFDRSFLQLHPKAAIITHTDADHLDIYGKHENLLEGFELFAGQVSDLLILKAGILPNLQTTTKVERYGAEQADWFASEIKAVPMGGFSFNLHCNHWAKPEPMELKMPGFHNVENALAASAMAWHYGLSIEGIRAGLASFEGVKRRFEFIIRKPDQVFVDDYAHHPTEISAFLKSLKFLFPHWPLVVSFQPHLFSRTRDFMDGFAESLSIADAVLLLDIYPARELPIEGIDSSALLNKIKAPMKKLVSKEELVAWVAAEKPPLFATIGAGDIDALVAPIQKALIE